MKCHVCGEAIEEQEYWIIGLDLSQHPPGNLYVHRPRCLNRWEEREMADGEPELARREAEQLPLTGT